MSDSDSVPWRSDDFDPVSWWSRIDGVRTAVIDGASDRHISYDELEADVTRWHTRLVQLGVRAGDRVAVLARNRYDHVPLLFACIRHRAVLVPLNWRLSAPELARVLVHASPRLLLGEREFRGLSEQALAAAAGQGGTVPHCADVDDIASASGSSITAAATHPTSHGSAASTAMLLYTSGSTGAPKAAMIPTRQLLWNALSTVVGWSLSERDVAVAATPFFHTAGWHVFTTPVLHCGGTVLVLPTFEPEPFLEALSRHAATMAFAVPSQFDALSRARTWGRALPALRTFITGGAPCPTRILEAVRKAGYAIRDAYGLTECGPNCFVTTDEMARAKVGIVGWPLPFLEMRVADEHDAPLPSGAVGELQLRGPQLFGGYYRDAEQTAAAYAANGWLRTGDLATVDADGVYRICGRRKELIISGGENVFPGEVEAALRECSGIEDAVVVGIPDEQWGEVGFALVVLRDSRVVNDGERLEVTSALQAELRSQLAGYKCPAHMEFTTALPRLASGKIDRRAVLEIAKVRCVRRPEDSTTAGAPPPA